ncbi:hypothetical protein AQJ66_08665 [Streptomyces bungoensis]|uniref:Uncharacterized protein n=1 Tax=Streptomyces bungoensis TaxID=285568 RepID=A0A124I4S7_9ACTN|nr:hypothetical protein AQJ66_08665 [Streptomyces bungoensis]
MASFAGAVVGALASSWAVVRRTAHERSEERRKEQVTHLTAFLAAVQEAERVAVDRWHHRMSDERWQARARRAVDRVWVTQKTLHLLCSTEINDAARKLAFAVHEVVRDGPGDPDDPQDEKVWAYIRPSRNEFLDAGKRHLRAAPSGRRS